MKKNYRCLVLIFVLFIGCGCGNNTNEHSDLYSEMEEDVDIYSNLKVPNEFKKAIALYAKGCNVVKVGESVTSNNYIYTINKVTLSKKQGDWIDETIQDAQLDEFGNVLNDVTYVIVDFEVEHMSLGKDDIDTFNWTNLTLDYFNLDGSIQESTDYTGIVGETIPSGTEGGFEEIPLGESRKKSLVYVVRDSFLKKGILYMVQMNFGMGKEDADSKDYCMIYLDTLVEELE